jgi:hypothetical protein
MGDHEALSMEAGQKASSGAKQEAQSEDMCPSVRTHPVL